MFKALILIALVFCIGLSCHVQAQDAGSRAQTLAAALDKNKYKKKEKHNISIEIYIDIKNEAVVKSNPAEYTGSYGGNDGYKLDLSVDADGAAQGSGYDTIGSEDKWPKTKFTLRDARVEGALLSGMKVYEDGRTEAFEAVFANRTVATGKNAETIHSRDTCFGIGFIQTQKDWTNRAFLMKND